ncbi:MAG: xanthine dehydrogenase family protein subunit M [Chloroflexi bacterium]|nr:xanthine dehydrogenase family protein subunit M [Chloroflexota bacterium]
MTTLAPFALHPARSVEEATGLLAELGDDAVIYAGGTELLLLMKLGFAAYGHLVDVKPIGELAGIGVVDGWLRIGGAVTHRAIERSPLIAAGWPALVSMERRVANVRVRSTGTLGGNLAFADPHSDPATFLVAAGARLVLGLGDERRRVPVTEFVRGSYETALQPTELLVAIEVPPLQGDAAMAHLRFAFHERPAATISCLARVRDGLLVETRIAVGSVGVMPVRAGDAESLLSGTPAADLPPSVLEAAGRAAAEAADPMTDANGSATYKRDLVRVLVGRCVREAADAARLRATAA